jgi:hypothetical protein
VQNLHGTSTQVPSKVPYHNLPTQSFETLPEAVQGPIHRYIHTYIHTCSVLMSSLPFTGYLKITNENFQKILFLCNSSHNLTPKRNELRYDCYLSQLYFHRALASCCSRKIEYYSWCRNTSSSKVSSGKRPQSTSSLPLSCQTWWKSRRKLAASWQASPPVTSSVTP